MQSHRDAIEAGKAAVQSYKDQAGALRGEQDQIRANEKDLRNQIATLCTDLVLSQLENVTPESVDAASAQFGAVRLPVTLRDISGRILAKEAIIRACEADASFSVADQLIDAAMSAAETARISMRTLRDELTRYEKNEDFHALRKAALPVPPPNALWVFFQTWVLFGWLYNGVIERSMERGRQIERQERLKRVTDAFECSLFEAISDRYDKLPGEIRAAEAEVASQEGNKRRLLELKDRHRVAVEERARLQAVLPDEVRRAFLGYLTSCEMWNEIRGRVDESLRLTISTIMALREKLKSLEQMSVYLGTEARDRDKRAGDIQRVIPKWGRNPGKRLRGDKTKWLVEGPARMAGKTSTTVTRVHTMHTSVYVYDNYSAFDRMVDAQLNFMLWDMVLHDHHGHFGVPMGFCNEVLPDVAQFHEENPEAVQELNAAYEEVGDPAADDASAVAADELASDGGEVADTETDSDDADTDGGGDDSMEDVS